MGKMNALLVQATAAIPPATPPPEAWGHETLATEEPPPAQATAMLDEVVEAASRAAREPAMDTPEPAEPPAPAEPEPPVLRVVEPTPVIRAVERLHQGVQGELRAVKAEVQGAASVARRQEDYLREVQRAHNAMATEWYQIAEALPAIRGELEELHAEIATRRAELTALREGAEEETRGGDDAGARVGGGAAAGADGRDAGGAAGRAGEPTGGDRRGGARDGDAASAPVAALTAAVAAEEARAHLAALGCDRYEIAVQDPDGTRVRRALLTADEAMLQISRLVALNGAGHEITVRPASGLASGLIVLDALDAAGLRRLRADGHAPAVLTGTGGTTDGLYQAWLRLSTDALDPQVAAQAAHDLQQRYGPDHGRALAHVGPLAGFVAHGAHGARGEQGDHTGARRARGEQGDHTGARRARGENEADMTSAGTRVSATPVTMQGAGDEPGRVTPAAARALAEAEERVEAQRDAAAHQQEQGGDGSARWGGRLIEAFAAELGRDDEPTGTADPWQRRRRQPGTGRTDDERDGRGDR